MGLKKILSIFLIINLITIVFSLNIDQTKKQIQVLEKWVAYDQTDHQSRSKLAEIYEDLGDKESLDRAKELYEEAFRIENKPYYHLKYGSLLIKISNYQWFPPSKMWYIISGYTEMEDVIEREDKLEYRFIRAESCFTSSNSFCLGIASEDYNHIIINYKDGEIEEEIEKIKYKLGLVYEKQKKYEKAIQIYEHLISEDISPEMRTEIIDRIDILQRVK
ncbi:tetratricopeptide repeat protein [Geotoga petraea]|jgi:tetratricopeptide (TPR) repeat protein|uniref:Tetratricopeptide repeat-containing protein n=1 Tax=Geotoga petraea TaxID=28234 RepID=A0A1G6P636_9BACT|nr:tetratricopeptide repeat protein [Geotoga petraea]SDC75662.1 Tetratricopeptide repeat-containing protein [Geotoga petraea]